MNRRSFLTIVFALQKGLLPVLFFAMGMSIWAQPIDLETAVRKASIASDRIRQYDAKLGRARWDERSARGNFLPQIRVDATLTHLNDPLEMDLDPIRRALISLEAENATDHTNLGGLLAGRPPLSAAQRQAVLDQALAGYDAALPPFKATLKDQNYPTASVTLVQPLFVGGKLLAAHRAAVAERHAAASERTRVAQEVQSGVVRTYLSVMLLQQVVATRREVCEGVNKHLVQATRLSEEGLIPETDVKRARVAVSDAERNLFDDLSRLDLARTALSFALGDDAGSAPIASDSLRYLPFTTELSSLVDAAFEGQPALQMIASKQKAAAQKVAAERSEFMPQVALFGRYELFPTYLSALEPEWAVGVRASFTLFDGFQRTNRLQSARRLTDEVRFLQDDARKQLQLLVTSSYGEMRRAEQRYRSLDAHLALAEENLRLAERRYDTGLGTSLEVIDAHLVREKTRIDRLTSLFDYYNALNTLLGATGRPNDLITLWKTR